MKTVEKKEKKDAQIISQCPDCRSLLMAMPDGRQRYVPTAVIFSKAVQEQCYPCKNKPSSTVVAKPKIKVGKRGQTRIA